MASVTVPVCFLILAMLALAYCVRAEAATSNEKKVEAVGDATNLDQAKYYHGGYYRGRHGYYGRGHGGYYGRRGGYYGGRHGGYYGGRHGGYYGGHGGYRGGHGHP